MVAIGSLWLACLVATAQDAEEKALRVVFVGNTLIERAAGHGYLEAALTQRWRDRPVTFRNLGWSGDTVAGSARVGFGPTEANRSSWRRPGKAGRAEYAFSRLVNGIRDAKPDILIVGYGSEAAFGGVDPFKKGLDQLLEEVAKTKARLVLLSPVRLERPRPELPDPAGPNGRLKQVTKIIRRAAAKREALFVNLFSDLKAPQGPASSIFNPK